jgi:ADP-heptose:LPS heptosyltransferase
VQRIGLAWAAGRKLDDPFTAREYRKRSLPLAALEQLIEALLGLGAELVNLQIGPDRSESAGMAHCFVDSLAETADFAATAALVLQLNLVICVDTALAHLVGALGHPGWVLLPFSADPRWLRQRSDCVWYPSLRLWRQQSRGDWRAPIDALTAELSDRLNRGSGW